MSDGKTVAVDFDGTIAGYEKGWQGAPGEDPLKGAADALRTMVMKGYEIVVFSCRANEPGGVQDIRNWLLRHNMMEFVSEITNVKPRAVAYVDDRGVAFRGDWLTAVQEVDALVAQEKKRKG